MAIVNCGIYKIENLVNGKIYVGQSVNINKRKAVHLHTFRNNKHHGSHIQNAWNKYGEENFIFKTILYCESSELTYYEQALVDSLSPEYNICKKCVDSPLGIKHTEEAVNNMKLHLIGNTHTKGHKLTEEHKRKVSESLKGENNYFFGRHLSAEHRKKIGDAQRGEKSSWYGRKHTEETKNKMSLAQKGKFVSEETRKKLSIAGVGKIVSKETGIKISKATRGSKRSEKTKRRISEAKKLWWKQQKGKIDDNN